VPQIACSPAHPEENIMSHALSKPGFMAAAPALTLALSLLPGAATAQQAAFPVKPVTMVIPLAPGGPVDTEMQIYLPRLRETFGQTFINDFRSGAAGAIAGAYVAKAPADGYTVLVINSAFTIFPAVQKNLAFSFPGDFAPITLMSKRPLLLMGPPSFAPNTFAEYVAFARANPGKINFGTTGVGAGTHLSGAWIHHATKTAATFVHYKGTGPLLPDLMSGRIDVSGVALPPGMPLIKSGKLKAIAMMSDRRSPQLPDLATIAEQGIPGYDYSSYTGFLAPAATPPAIVNRLHEGFIKVLRNPEVSARLEADGNAIIGNTPAQFRLMLLNEVNHWSKLVQETGIKAED
jgi:tripartite-type tricarboxylate transporter receptor subunit TctC